MRARDAHVAEFPLRNLAIENGMRTLQMDAVQKIIMGITTVDEVLRVIYA